MRPETPTRTLLADVQAQGLNRRTFLRNLLLSAGSISTAQWLTACGGADGSPTGGGGGLNPNFNSRFATMGPLQAPDDNGVQLPEGFTSRVLAVINEPPIPENPDFLWHSDPDGGGVFRTDDGGWIYVSNSEARDATTLFGQIPAVPVLSDLATRDSLETLNSVLGPITGLTPVPAPLAKPPKPLPVMRCPPESFSGTATSAEAVAIGGAGTAGRSGRASGGGEPGGGGGSSVGEKSSWSWS